MDINYGHLGNGLTFWDRDIQDERTRDYANIAFIDHNRSITFYKNLRNKDKQFIINIALTSDPEVSVTQDTKVFSTRPEEALNPETAPEVKYKFHLYNGTDKDTYAPRPEKCPICGRGNFKIKHSQRTCTYCHNSWKKK